MLKHILTTACPRRCSYCLTRNVPVLDVVVSPKRIQERYRQLRDEGCQEIMLTGGEPTCHPIFPVVVQLAWSVFRKVHITTQNTALLDGSLPLSRRLLSSAVLSVHDLRALREVLSPDIVLPPFPVYVAVMASSCYDSLDTLAHQLHLRGYAGMTINEDQRGTGEEELSLAGLRAPYVFSVRINRRGTCLDDTPILLPDLTLISSFRPYL
jgi:hypothetical protein